MPIRAKRGTTDDVSGMSNSSVLGYNGIDPRIYDIAKVLMGGITSGYFAVGINSATTPAISIAFGEKPLGEWSTSGFLGVPALSSQNPTTGLAYGNDRLLITIGNKIAFLDTLALTGYEVGQSLFGDAVQLLGTHFGNNTFVVRAANGMIAYNTGTDLTTGWVELNLSGFLTSSPIVDIKFANGRWVAMSATGAIAATSGTSISGTWTAATSTGLTGGSFFPSRLAFGGGYWIACAGEDTPGGKGKLVYTTNPTGTWTSIVSSTFDEFEIFNNISYLNGAWLVSGRGLENMGVYSTSPLTSWNLIPHFDYELGYDPVSLYSITIDGDYWLVGGEYDYLYKIKYDLTDYQMKGFPLKIGEFLLLEEDGTNLLYGATSKSNYITVSGSTGDISRKYKVGEEITTARTLPYPQYIPLDGRVVSDSAISEITSTYALDYLSSSAYKPADTYLSTTSFTESRLLHKAFTFGSFNSVTYGNRLWVVVGNGGKILISKDALSWIEALSPTTDHLYHVCYENGVYVAVGAASTILMSYDGKVWIKLVTGIANTFTFRKICYGGGAWAVVGDANVMYYNTVDLRTVDWIANNAGLGSSAYNATSIVFWAGPTGSNTYWFTMGDNGKYVYRGAIAAAVTSITHPFGSAAGNVITDLHIANGYFVICGTDGRLAYATTFNGTYTSLVSSPNTMRFNGILYYGNGNVAAARGWVGCATGGFYPRLLNTNTPNAAFTVNTTLGSNYSFNGIACGDGKIIMVGNNTSGNTGFIRAIRWFSYDTDVQMKLPDITRIPGLVTYICTSETEST